MKALISFSLALALSSSWSSVSALHPDDINVRSVLNSAREDMRMGDYAQALEKHQWFHTNALQYAPSFAGVRLSFALSDWLKLADVYPPAKTALLDELKKAKSGAMSENASAHRSFQDYVAINSYLGRSADSIQFFKKLSQDNPQRSRQFVHYIERHLYKAGEHRLLRDMIDPRERLRMVFSIYDANKRFAFSAPETDMDLVEYADNEFNFGVGNLVALLTTLGESDFAREIGNAATKKIQTEALTQTLEKAYQGVFPTPLF